MFQAIRIVLHMGSLQRLMPFWLLGIVLIAWNPQPWMIAAVIYGGLMQFFVEYTMHRFLFHREPPSEQGTFNELYRSHIGHHEFPKNPEFFTGGDNWYALRFGLISAVLHAIVLAPFVGIASAANFALIAVFVGSASAFAFYEFCHTLAHINVPKGWFGQRITHSHMRHHFKDHESNFHVSFGMAWIDRLFGTPYEQQTAKDRFDSETILSMGMNPDDLRLVTARKTYGLPRFPSAKVSE